jgi:tRNA-specific 2-thiouridylase
VSGAQKTVVVAMSGGVDSSVAAALLVEQGYRVLGVTLQIWQEAATETKGAGCCSLGAVEDARRVAAKLDIPFYVLNYQEPFADAVIKPFIEDYRRGRTPNPCINCNRHIKFDALLEKTKALGADKLATGHYARVIFDETLGRHALVRAGNIDKDQTYALYATQQHQLAHMTMPLGDIPDKSITREIARKYGLSVANKPDSQEICFVQGKSYTEFLASEAPELVTTGRFVDSSGKLRGTHEGSAFYTVGQRKRINVGSAIPLYVLGVDAQSNTVVIGPDEELYSDGCRVEDVTWVSLAPPPVGEAVDCQVKIRYNMTPRPARAVRRSDETLSVTFTEPLRAVTPGQACVLYGVGDYDGYVLGGGTITEKR